MILGYLGLIVVVGFRVSRGVKTARDFFLAGRSLPWWIIGLSIIGTNIDSNNYVGASGNAYATGLAQANFEWIGAIPAMIIASLIFIPIYWKAGVYSIPEYLGRRYSQSVRLLVALIFTLSGIFVLSIAMYALAITLETYLGWPIVVGVLVSGLVVAAYSISGGLSAVTFTDALQVSIMFGCAIIVAYLGFMEMGGISEFLNRLEAKSPTHLNPYLPANHPDFPWTGVILGLGIVLSPAYWIGSQAILQRTLAAKSQWDASASMMFAAMAKTFVPLLIIFPGILAFVMEAQIENPDMALPWVIKNVLPVGVSGLMFVAIIAALQSTIDSGVNTTALMITRDIRQVLLKQSDDRDDLKIGRALSLCILTIAMIAAPFIEHLGGIYIAVQNMLSLFQGPMLALLCLGALTKFVTPQAGLWTLITGVPLSGVLLFSGMNMLFVAFISFCYALVCLTTLSYWTKPLPLNELHQLTFNWKVGQA